MTINVEKLSTLGAPRLCIAVVNDTADNVFGHSNATAFNVVSQPGGSDIFAGLGTAGVDVPVTDLPSATFAVAGRYSFTAAASGEQTIGFGVVCCESACLTAVPSVSSGALVNKRSVLKAVALDVPTFVGTAATLPSALAPYGAPNPGYS